MKKTLMTLGTVAVMATALTQFTACKNPQCDNPLLCESTLPFGAPDFSKIQPADYLPAFKTAIAEKREEIKKIVDNAAPANFENTILALEESGKTLNRVSHIFFALVEADKTPEIGEPEKAVTPMLTDLGNEIMFNKQLFARISCIGRWILYLWASWEAQKSVYFPLFLGLII